MKRLITCLSFCVWSALLAGCFVDFKVPVADGASDPRREDARRDDFVIDPPSDEEEIEEDEEDLVDADLSNCGNGRVDPGEECDQEEPEACTTECGTSGLRYCRSCRWRQCEPPDETCDGIDQNCDGFADDWLWQIREAPFHVNQGGDPSLSPALTWTDPHVSIVWEDQRTGNWQLTTSAIGADLTVHTSEAAMTSSTYGAQRPSIAWDGFKLVAAWIDRYGSDLSRDVYAQGFAEDGSSLTAMLNVSSGEAGDERDTALVWTGTQFGAAWSADSGVVLSLIASDLSTVNSFVLSDSTETGDVSMAWSGSRFGVFWEDGTSGNSNIHARIVESNGSAVGDVLILNDDPTQQSSPACTYGNSEFTVLWEDNRGGENYEIYGSTLQDNGIVSASQYWVASCYGDCLEPAIVWSGDSFSIAIVDQQEASGDVFIMRTAPDGTAINDTLNVGHPGVSAGHPALTWNGSELAVVYEGTEEASENIYLLFAGCM